MKLRLKSKKMKTLDYTFVADQKELEEMIENGFTMLLSIVNDNRGKYVACHADNYKEVFEEVTEKKYSESDGTFGSAFPITETFGADSIFDI